MLLMRIGQFFDKYLRYIRLNDKPVKFTQMDLSYLEKVSARIFSCGFFRTFFSFFVAPSSCVVCLVCARAHAVRICPYFHN